MHIEVKERASPERISVSLSKGEIVIPFLAIGVKDSPSDTTPPTQQQILLEVIRQAPDQLYTLFRSTVEAEEVDSVSWAWDVKVTYLPLDWAPKETGDSVIQFTTAGGVAKIQQALMGTAVTQYKSSTVTGTIPETKGAIGVTSDSVEGCEIGVGLFGFQATVYMAPSLVTMAYLQDLYTETFTTNNDTWSPVIDGLQLTFPEGVVLFQGATGARRGQGDFEMVFNFAVAPHRTDLVVGDMTGISKRAWDYLDVEFSRKADGSGDAATVIQIPLFVRTQRVYGSSDFGKLKLPTTKFLRNVQSLGSSFGAPSTT